MENYKVEIHSELTRALNEKRREIEDEYFELLAGVDDFTKSINTMAGNNNLLRMTVADQVLVLRKMSELGDLLSRLCEKYGLEGGTDDEH